MFFSDCVFFILSGEFSYNALELKLREKVMNIKLIVTTIITTMMLSGCSTTFVPPEKNLYGWNNVNPPRQNVLGYEVLSKGVIGQPIYNLDSDNILVSDSIGKVTSEQYLAAQYNFDVLAKKATAELGYEYTKSEKLTSNSWKISQIRNLEHTLPVNRRFAYQCLNASNYEFTATSNSGIDATIDATKIAARFGVDKAKVTFKTKPDKPSDFTVIVNDPSVCISYVTAYFEENNGPIFNRTNEHVAITGPDLFESSNDKGKNSYELKPGETSYRVSPLYKFERPPAINPEYNLTARQDNQGLIQLLSCKDKTTYKCKTIKPDDDNGNWNGTYLIDTFAYGKQKYKVINMNIKARRTPNGTIEIKSAKLYYPQYKLVIE